MPEGPYGKPTEGDRVAVIAHWRCPICEGETADEPGDNDFCLFCGRGKLERIEYVDVATYRGAVDREREILRELRISGADLDGERLAAWIERRWPDFGGQSDA